MNTGLLKHLRGTEKKEFEKEYTAAGRLFDAYYKGSLNMSSLADHFINEAPKIVEALVLFDTKSHETEEEKDHYREHRAAFRLLIQYNFIGDRNQYKLVLTRAGVNLLACINEKKEDKKAQAASSILR